MSVRVEQKYRRGVAGDRSASAAGFLAVDVTSGSGNKIGGVPAKTLSPMTLGPVFDASYGSGGGECRFFESYWQHGKMWPSAGHIGDDGSPTAAWYAFRERGYAAAKAKRRPLPAKQYGRPTASFYNGRLMGYVESRKLIYVPIYRRLIESLPIIAELRKLLASGQDILVIDGDGPPKDMYPNGLELNRANWDRMIDDPNHPFGHGYVVAALLANLDPAAPQHAVGSAPQGKEGSAPEGKEGSAPEGRDGNEALTTGNGATATDGEGRKRPRPPVQNAPAGRAPKRGKSTPDDTSE